MLRSTFACVIAFATAACSHGAAEVSGPPPVGYCSAVSSPGISVTVTDSLTGGGRSFAGLYAVAVDGTFRDSTTFATADSTTGVLQIRLAYNRAGMYAVTVHADGYRQWTRSSVLVSPTGFCSTVINVPLTARLVVVGG